MQHSNGRSVQRRRVVERNGVIFRQGEESRIPTIVDEGLVRLCDYLPDGQRVVIAFVFPGELIGTELYSTNVTVEAVTRVLLRAWPGGNTGFETAEAEALIKAMHQLNAAAAVRAHRQLEARVAAFLIDMIDRGVSNAWHLPISRSDLADHLILSVHTLSRVMTNLQRSGVISRTRARGLKIIDLDRLRGIADEGMPPLSDTLSPALPYGITH